jgi:outer membrane protein assembly factor BamB
VYCNGRSATSAQIFAVPVPIITSFIPTIAGPGAIITITGQNFNSNILLDSVFFNTAKAEIISVSATQITVRVPQNGSTGLIKVHSNCQLASSSNPFTFSNKGIVYASSNSRVCFAIDISSGTTIWDTTTNSGFRSSPTYNNGVIYIGSSDVNNLSNNNMFALNALTGKKIWSFNAGPWNQVPIINQGVLYAGAFDKKLYALNALTGQQIWSFTAGGYFSSDGPTYYNGKVYSNNDDGYFYCLNATTGTLNWRLNIYPGGNPAVVNGIVYTAGAGVFYALDANDGTTIWSIPMQYLSGSSPTVVNGAVYIAAENHQIYDLNALTGNIIWQREASWWVGSAVIVVDNILYVHSGDGVIGAVNATNGAILWSKALPGSSLPGACPVVANGILFVGDESGKLNALNAITGETIWTKSLGGYPMISSPCVVDSSGRVYFAGDSGNQQ